MDNCNLKYILENNLLSCKNINFNYIGSEYIDINKYIIELIINNLINNILDNKYQYSIIADNNCIIIENTNINTISNNYKSVLTDNLLNTSDSFIQELKLIIENIEGELIIKNKNSILSKLILIF